MAQHKQRRGTPAVPEGSLSPVAGSESAWTFQRRSSPRQRAQREWGSGGRSRNSWGSPEIRREGRCRVCNDPKSHRCPVDDRSLHGLTAVRLDRTPGNHSDCFADWHDEPCPDGNTYIKVYYKTNERGSSSYVFIGDDKKQWVGSTDFRPTRSRKYLDVSASDLPVDDRAALLEAARERVARGMVYGNSLRQACSTGHNEAQITRLASMLAEETVLMRALKRSSTLLRERPRSISIRMTKGLVDFHDMDTSSAIIMGDAARLDELVRDFTPDPNISDAATMLVHVDTRQFMECDDVLALPEVRSALESLAVPVERPRELRHHLKLAKGAMNDIKDTPGMHFYSRVLLTVCNYDDKCYIDIPGGMRELGETPLECAMKECTEEAGVKFTDANLRVKGDSSVSGAEARWELYLHNQSGVNQYFIHAITACTVDNVAELTNGMKATSIVP